jgi:hypothetical protein
MQCVFDRGHSVLLCIKHHMVKHHGGEGQGDPGYNKYQHHDSINSNVTADNVFTR